MPSPRSDEASAELSAAARHLGKPLLRLNNLTRWYVRTALVFLLLPAVMPAVELAGETVSPGTALPWLSGGILLFAGGLSLKFLPSSLGANPEVHSPRLALVSYWLVVLGTLVWGAGTFPAAEEGIGGTVSPGGALGVLAGGVLLLYNVWRSTGENL